MKSTFVILWHHLKDFHTRIYGLLVFIVFYELLKLAPAAVLAIVIDTIIAFDPSAVTIRLASLAHHSIALLLMVLRS